MVAMDSSWRSTSQTVICRVRVSKRVHWIPNWPSEKPNWLFLSRRQFNQFTLNGTFVGEPENIEAMQWVIFSFIPASRGVWQQSLYGAGTTSVYSGSGGNYESEVSWALFCGQSSVTYLRKTMLTSQYPQQFVYPADVFSTVHHLILMTLTFC